MERWKRMGLSSWIVLFREGRKALGPDSPLLPFCSRLSVFTRTISGSWHSWGCGTGHLPALKGTGMRKPQDGLQATDRKLCPVWSRTWDSTFLRKQGFSLELRRRLPEPELLDFSTFRQMGGVEVQLVQSLRAPSQVESWLFSWGQTNALRNKPARTEPTKGRSKTAASLQRKERSQRYRMKNSVIVYHCRCNAGGWGTLPGILRSSWDPDPLRIPKVSVRHYGPTPSSLGAQAG